MWQQFIGAVSSANQLTTSFRWTCLARYSLAKGRMEFTYRGGNDQAFVRTAMQLKQ